MFMRGCLNTTVTRRYDHDVYESSVLVINRVLKSKPGHKHDRIDSTLAKE
jgi:hypothetical protein